MFTFRRRREANIYKINSSKVIKIGLGKKITKELIEEKQPWDLFL